jgi:hypothetical protein
MPSALIEARSCASGGKIVIPAYLSSRLDGDVIVQVFVWSRKKIEIFGIRKRRGFLIANVLLKIKKDSMAPVVRFITDTYKDKEIEWTTGFCVASPDEAIAGYEGCLWQGIMHVPEKSTIKDISLSFMQINVLNKQIIVDECTVSMLEIEKG